MTFFLRRLRMFQKIFSVQEEELVVIPLAYDQVGSG